MVSIIVITRNSKTLQECVESIYDNTNVDYELIIVNGGEDIDTSYFNNCTREVKAPKDATLTEQFDIGYKNANGRYVTMMCDDHFPKEAWLLSAKAMLLSRFPDGMGFVCMNELRGWHGEKACVFLVPVKFVKKYLGGYVLDTRFSHFRCDVELADRARKTGKYVYCKDAKVEHRHIKKPEVIKEYWKKDANTYKQLCES